MSEIVYKQATVEDAHILIDNIIAFSREYNGNIDPEIEKQLRESQAAFFKEAIPNKTYIGWYAMINNEAVAIGGLCIRLQPGNIKNISGRMGYVFSMYTKPEHRKKGISSHILNKLLETGKEMGITAYELHATKDGEPVYVKNGFILFKEPTYRKIIMPLD